MLWPSGATQAAPISDKADARCAKLAIKTLGASYNPSNFTFVGGTEGIDNFTDQGTAGQDVFCGFGGSDSIGSISSPATLDEGDIFLGGAGRDLVYENSGTFYGQEGDDFVFINFGTFVQ